MAAAQSSTINMHVLEKLWAVGRVIAFASHEPRRVFALALINRAFRECMLEYQHAKFAFERIFDARSEWQSRLGVAQVWILASKIMKQKVVASGVVAQMVAAMQTDNRRALLELEAAEAAPPRARDDPNHPEHASVFDPHPAAARHRWVSQLGLLTVAWRDALSHRSVVPKKNEKDDDEESSQPVDIPWFRDVSRSLCGPHVDGNREERLSKAADSLPLGPRICPNYDASYQFFVIRNSQGFLTGLIAAGQNCGVQSIDTSLMPSTISLFSMDNTPIMRGCFDLEGFAAACPRLIHCGLSGCRLSMQVHDLTKVLAMFPVMERCYLYDNDIRTGNGLDLTKLSRLLNVLYVYGNEGMSGQLRLSASVIHFQFQNTGLTL
jgi:hypothetical protein